MKFEAVRSAGGQASLSALLELMTSSNKLSSEEYTRTLLGSLVTAYYGYVATYHVYPRDMEELVDGLLFIDAKNYAMEEEIEEHKRKAEREQQSSRIR